MTPKQFVEFLNYISENNSWGKNMYEVVGERNRIPYKYIDATWDARDNTVFSITLRPSGGKEGKIFRVDTPKDIERLYEYLDKPLRLEV